VLPLDPTLSCTDDRCPSEDCFYSFSICVREFYCKGGDSRGDEAGSGEVDNVDSTGDGGWWGLKIPDEAFNGSDLGFE